VSKTVAPEDVAQELGETFLRLAVPCVFFVAAIAFADVALADPCEAPLPRQGTTFTGPVTYVGDGDSLCVTTTAGQVEIRLADFNAPELQEPGGPQARETLRRLVMGRRATCRAGRRSYDRVVARCEVGGTSVGDLMRRAGIREGGR